MFFDAVELDYHDNVTFMKNSIVVADVGIQINDGDFVVVGFVNDECRLFKTSLYIEVKNKEERRQLINKMWCVYLTNLIGNYDYKIEVLDSGIIKYNTNPTSLNGHITINSELFAVVTKNSRSQRIKNSTSMKYSSPAGGEYTVDILSPILCTRAYSTIALSKLTHTLTTLYEGWRSKHASEEIRSTLSS